MRRAKKQRYDLDSRIDKIYFNHIQIIDICVVFIEILTSFLMGNQIEARTTSCVRWIYFLIEKSKGGIIEIFKCNRRNSIEYCIKSH